jgi:hypothetical protein
VRLLRIANRAGDRSGWCPIRENAGIEGTAMGTRKLQVRTTVSGGKQGRLAPADHTMLVFMALPFYIHQGRTQRALTR